MIANDVVVVGKDVAEHHQNLHHFMKVTQEHGLVLRFQKCAIRKPWIKFYGFCMVKEWC